MEIQIKSEQHLRDVVRNTNTIGEFIRQLISIEKSKANTPTAPLFKSTGGF